MKMSWERVLTALLAVMSLSMGSVLAYDQLSDCCRPGAACCKPGAACCAAHKH
jgi:hypothetical protein